MGNTPSRGPEDSVPSNRDEALERLRALRHEYGNGINANILVENAIGEGYVVTLSGESSECGRWHQMLQPHVGFGQFAVGSHCKRDGAGYGLGVALLFRVTPPDRNIDEVVMFGVGIDVPHGMHKLSGVSAVGNIDQSSDILKLVENARYTRASISSVVHCNIECSVEIKTDDVFLPTHPKIHIAFKKFK